MGLLDKLFRRKRGLTEKDVPPEFRPIVARLDQLPPKQQQAVEQLIRRALDAGVYTLDDMLSFLESEPTAVVLFWSRTVMSLSQSPDKHK